MKLSKGHIITKNLFLCVVGLVEFVGIPILLAYLSTYILPFDDTALSLASWIERTVLCFTVYEIIILITRKLIVDSKKDMLLALKNAYELGELYIVNNKTVLRDQVNKLIDAELDSGVLNNLRIREDYQHLKTFMERKQLFELKCKKVFINHSLEACDLFWELTLFLRLFK